METAEKCRQKEGADEGAIEALKNQKLTEYPNGKCMAACMFEEEGIMKDNAFNKEAAMSMAGKALAGHKDKLEKVKEIMEDCEKEISEITGDRCEVASEIFDCSRKMSVIVL
ncbi:uncharacterized protein LOC142331584 isoform X2 [Lycorma delicatula]